MEERLALLKDLSPTLSEVGVVETIEVEWYRRFSP